METKVNDFIKIYEYFQSHIAHNPEWELREDQKKKIEKFLMENDISDIWEYLAFIFSFKANSRLRYKILPLNQIVGKNALKRFSERNKRSTFMVSRFLMANELRDPRKKQEKLGEEYIDFVRSKNINNPKGFLECQTFEGLIFDEEKCKECEFKNICNERGRN